MCFEGEEEESLLLGCRGMTSVKWKLNEAGILSGLLTAVFPARTMNKS